MKSSNGSSWFRLSVPVLIFFCSCLMRFFRLLLNRHVTQIFLLSETVKRMMGYGRWDSPAESQVFFVAPEDRRPCSDCGFGQHVMQDDHLDHRQMWLVSYMDKIVIITLFIELVLHKYVLNKAHCKTETDKFNLTWSLPRSPTTTNMVRCCRATPFSIWTRIRLSTFFRIVAIVLLLLREIREVTDTTTLTQRS